MKKYSGLWIFSVTLFILSTSLIIGIGNSKYFLEFQIIFNIINSIAWILVLRICCAIYKLPHRAYLDKYCAVMIMFVTILYNLQMLESIILLPLFIFQFITISEIVYKIIKTWTLPLQVKLICLSVFMLYGLLKMYISFTITNNNYLELIFLDLGFLILVNFNFTMLFIISAQHLTRTREGYIYDLAEKAIDIVFYYTIYPYAKFTFISPSVEATTGYKQNDFYKNPKIHIELTHEDDREIAAHIFSPSSNERTRGFVRWQRKDGEYIYLEYNNNPIESNGKIIAVEGMLRDATDSKLAEKELIETQKTQQLFLSYISHELKTPITYIMGYTEMLRKNLWTEAEKAEGIDLIYTKAETLEKLIEDLFQLSKMEANHFSFKFMQVSAYSLFQLLDVDYGGDVVTKGISYTSTIDKNIEELSIEVLADIKRIEQVHSNILQNAINYAGASAKITFECELDKTKENVLFKISDMGPGINTEELDRIFEPFYRSEGSKKANSAGTGIGLALSKQIMLSHHGSIYANSKKGQGSRFTYSIPIYIQV